MATSDGGCVKEETVRDLVLNCKAQQGKIQELLNKNFCRQPQKEGELKGYKSLPNVLDEIINDLEELNAQQMLTIDFIIRNINLKL